MFLIFILIIFRFLPAQQLPNLPLPIGAGTAEVWRDTIYYFGGSNNWAGTILYPDIYKFDGTAWSYHGSIPDNEMWDVESVLVGNNIYLLSGWRYGSQFNRKYDLVSKQWVYMANSPNTQTWGVTAEYLGGIIYLFDSYGNVFAYDIASDQWSNHTSNSSIGYWDLSSILYKNEIYIIGWENLGFYKYTPATDQWYQLANTPYSVGASAMGVINDSIFCIGGNSGNQPQAHYRSVIVYDIPSNTWSVDSTRLSSRRHWMATAIYKGGLYVIGGIDSLSNAVDIVEEIVPQGTSVDIKEEKKIAPTEFLVSQNYPNPFNPSTTILFHLPQQARVILRIIDPVGQEIEKLVDNYLPAGNHEKVWQANHLPSGIYFYELTATSTAENFKNVKKLILVK